MSLEVKEITVQFDEKTILNHLSFSLAEGEIGCLLGHSGCGKTTALRVIAGFENTKSGSVCLDGATLSDVKIHIPAHKRGIGMVFQDYALFPHLRVSENIAFGLHKNTRAEKQQRVEELLELIGMSEYAQHYPHQLSGGQQQRVALARALAPRPKLILLDEPFSNLDADLRLRLSQDVRQLLKHTETSGILVTHDQNEAFIMADKIGMMADGVLQQWGTAAELYHQPINQQVAAFIGQSSFIEGEVHHNEVHTVLGLIPINTSKPEAGQDKVQVLIRPEDIGLEKQSSCRGTIIHKDFKGNCWQYKIQLNKQETIEAQWQEDLPIGEQIGLKWVGKQAAVFPIK